jgi:hypothetical protein
VAALPCPWRALILPYATSPKILRKDERDLQRTRGWRQPPTAGRVTEIQEQPPPEMDMNTSLTSAKTRARARVLGIFALAALLFGAGCIVVPAHPHYYRHHHCHYHHCR